MNKMQMAHDMALAMAANGNVPNEDIVAIVWQYVDAMQVEADERNKAEAEQKRKEVREILNDANTFIEREGQHFDDVEEWQPDWSQAPEWANWWAMDDDGGCYWFEDEPHMCDFSWQPVGLGSMDKAFNHKYQGHWKDSLRKRPESMKNIDPKEYIDAVLQDIVDPCDHEWTHISKFGAEGDFYVCPCGAKSKRPQRRTK